MRKVTFAILGVAVLGAVATASTAVSAMPLPSFAMPSSSAEQVRYVCNEWGRCWWRPDYRRPYGYGYGYRYRGEDDVPRYYRRPYGYYGDYDDRGGYRGWHRRWDDD